MAGGSMVQYLHWTQDVEGTLLVYNLHTGKKTY